MSRITRITGSDQPTRARQLILAAATAAVGVSFTSHLALAGGTVDGTLASEEYAFTLGVQDTPTQFGDNLSELNAAYADVLSDGTVRLMLTGNLETNGNGIVIFFDNRAGGGIANTLPGGYGEFGSIGGARTDDWGTDINGSIDITPTPGGPSVVSPGFNPELSFEINSGGGTGDYFINLIDMTVPNEPLPNRDVFLGQNMYGQPAVTQTYFREPLFEPFGEVTHAFDNSNTAGVLGYDSTTPPGPLGDPLSATTGFEASFSSLFLNQDPLQPIKILPFITNGGGDYLSNQFLPGLGGLANLEGPGGSGGTPLFDVRSLPNADNFYLVIPLPTWQGASGVWSTDTAWSSGHAPNGVNTSAIFAGTGGAVEVLNPVTVGGIGFHSMAPYNIAGPATITLDTHPRFDGSARPARFEVTDGMHTISAPMVWNQDVVANIVDGRLTISGAVSGTDNRNLTKQGIGDLVMERLRFANVDVQGGILRVSPGTLGGDPGKASKIGSLAIAGGPSSPSAIVDLTNNILIVSSPAVQDVRSYIAAGHDGGQWTGAGIITSSGDASSFGLGYATADQLGVSGTYAGLPIMGTDTIVRLTRYGDANLDNVVNLADFNALAGNFGQSGKFWIEGDFNYDSLVNLADFNLLAGNFGLSAGADGPTAGDWAALAAAVPEPGGAALFGGLAVSAAMLRRRRSRQRA